MSEPLTPEEYQKLLEIGAQNAKISPRIKMQQEQAKRLRASGGRQVAIGGIGGLAQGISQGLQMYKAGQLDKASQAGETTAADNSSQQNNMIMQAILRGSQMNRVPTATPPINPQTPQDPYGALRAGGI
jgi:hypothetical protein